MSQATSADRPFDLVVAGHLCLDIIPLLPDSGARRVEELFRPGALLSVGPCTLSTGGAVSNTGLAAVRLGCRVAFNAKVGDDAYAGIIRALLGEAGSAVGIRSTPDACSSYTVVLAPPGIDRMFLHCPGANDTFGQMDVDYDLVAQARLFHFGYPPLMQRLYSDEGRELVEIFRQAKAVGATTSLDLAVPDPHSPAGRAPWERILAGVLPYVDLFLPSLEEAWFALERDTFLARKQAYGSELLDQVAAAECATLAGRFLELGAGIVVLKTGHHGLYLRSSTAATLSRFGAARPNAAAGWAERECWQTAIRPERIASATGAGDASIAGFLTALLRGHPVSECLRVAACVGCQNLAALDAVSGIRSWQETWAMAQRSDLPWLDSWIEGQNWRRAEAAGLWLGPRDRGA
ncbi:MAG: carbohydrate kinase family protein [Phycisphaerales bacterium]|nr:carbohydrate kinase family protein [Phycisphaerales bacterium]